MSSIRPLITITILVAVGVFLFTKINEGPVPLPAEMDAAMSHAPPAEIPPLTTATTAPAPLTPTPAWSDPPSGASESKPQWAEGASESVAATPPTAPPQHLAPENSSASAPPTASVATTPTEMPPIPELPPLAPAPETSDATKTAAATTSTTTAPIPLPTNIPVAQYPGDVAKTSSDAATVTPPAAVEAQAPASTTTPTTVASAAAPTPPTAEAVSPAADPSANRYGITPTEPVAAAPAAVTSAAPAASASTPTFASAWPEIHAALERQELVAAHEMLSRWYGNPSLTPAEAQQVEVLLSQLAGTVVYSTEHRLEPPYTVHSGDTLQTIAQHYDVPWQLLAKINGIPAANMVQPGQQLKVVHGPFSAVVELDKSQLTLMLDGRYAGRFPISVADSTKASEGQWVLEQKLINPTTEATGVVSASYAPAAVDHVLVLRNESPTAAGATISITSGKPSPSGPTAIAPAAIRLSPRDVEEVADILSVGSTVTIRR